MTAFDRDRPAARFELRTERPRHDLRMVARLLRLLDHGYAFGLEPREENRRLHLRAGDGRRVMNALDPRAVNLERRAAVAAHDTRPHFFQRLHDPLHPAAP